MAYNAGLVELAEVFGRYSTIVQLCDLLIAFLFPDIGWHIRVPDLASKYSVGL